eukprot:scaffold248400_cov37-Cyclotella_meneghiniana.AAC.7
MNTNRTGDRLSPCRTPLVCGIDIALPSMLMITLRLEYRRWTMLMNEGGAPYFSSSLRSTSWLAVS